MECLGCGITRSVQHLIHFQFQEAWAFNKLVVVVFPALVYFWFTELRKMYLKLKL